MATDTVTAQGHLTLRGDLSGHLGMQPGQQIELTAVLMRALEAGLAQLEAGGISAMACSPIRASAWMATPSCRSNGRRWGTSNRASPPSCWADRHAHDSRHRHPWMAAATPPITPSPARTDSARGRGQLVTALELEQKGDATADDDFPPPMGWIWPGPARPTPTSQGGEAIGGTLMPLLER